MREAGPIYGAETVGHRGTHWGALLFTLLVAATLAGAVVTRPWAPELSPDVTAPVARASAAPSASATAAPTAPPASAIAGELVLQTAPPVIVLGATTTIELRYRNTGTAEWRRATASEIRLGVVGRTLDEEMRVEWLHPERPAAQSEAVVAPGQVVNFIFQVKGTQRGTFRLELRPVVDGVTWLEGKAVMIEITVQ